jgi:hypothetical protein
VANKFGLLERLGQTDPASLLQADPPRSRRPKHGVGPRPLPQAVASSGGGEEGGVEDLEEEDEEEGLAQRLDSFLLAHIFSHLHDGPLLARLRLVPPPLPFNLNCFLFSFI